MTLDNFICKEEINAEKEIAIPKDANYIKMKKGYAYFFREQNGTNECIKIPENSTKMGFPDYRRHCCHIIYGNPYFQK